MEKNPIFINEDRLETASSVIRALSHPLRLKILDFIDKNKMINVNKIYNTLNLEQSITSQHLRILRVANLVATQRDGKQIFYAVNYEHVRQVMEAIRKFQGGDKEK